MFDFPSTLSEFVRVIGVDTPFCIIQWNWFKKNKNPNQQKRS